MLHQVRVIFGDTDQMGVVYYANYLRYFESARADFLRQAGGSGKDFDRWGIMLPVIEAHCEYRRSAHYEDLLEVETTVSELRGASFRFDYVIRRGDEVLAEGYTRHASISMRGRPTRLPAELIAMMKQGETEPTT